MDDVIILAAQLFHVRPGDIQRSAIHHHGSYRVCEARHAVAYALRERFGMSLREIGTMLGGRDHTTIINSLRVAENRAKYNPRFAANVAQLLIEEPVTPRR
jgi:chromosomal replication initiation ATPase DnaA